MLDFDRKLASAEHRPEAFVKSLDNSQAGVSPTPSNRSWGQMPSVVMITFGFPPEGGVGVFRPLRFARHLVAKGWTPIIVTADLEPYGYERYDPGLLSSIPHEIDVIRVQWHDRWQLIQAARRHRIETKLVSVSAEVKESIRASQNIRLRAASRAVVRACEAHYYHP